MVQAISHFTLLFLRKLHSSKMFPIQPTAFKEKFTKYRKLKKKKKL